MSAEDYTCYKSPNLSLRYTDLCRCIASLHYYYSSLSIMLSSSFSLCCVLSVIIRKCYQILNASDNKTGKVEKRFN